MRLTKPKVSATRFTIPLGLGVAAAGGALTALSSQFGLALIGALALFLIYLRLGTGLTIAAFATAPILSRLGGGGAELSISDAAQIALTLSILPFLPKFGPNFKRFAMPVALYLLVALLPPITSQLLPAAVEWVHRSFIVGGGLLLGWFVGRTGNSRRAGLLYLAAATLMSVLAVRFALTTGFQPAFIGAGLQKNTLGSFLFIAVVLVHIRPAWLDIKPRTAFALQGIFVLGLAASQSRGAIIAVLLALTLAALFLPEIRKRTLVLGAVGFVPTAIIIIQSLLVDASEAASNSLGTVAPRLAYRSQALSIWRENPIFGEGYKIFRVPGSGLDNDPHNLIVLTLAEAGIIGLLALGVLLAVVVFRATKLPKEACAVILGLILGRAIHGMVDVYWVGGTQTIVWLFVGLTLGVLDRSEFSKRRPISRNELHQTGAGLPPQFTREEVSRAPRRDPVS